MSIGKSSSNQSSDAAKVWGGQAPYLQSLYGQGQNALGQANQFNNQVAPMLQNLMNPTNFGQMIAQAGAPMLQGIQDNSIQAMNLGGSRQGIAQGQLGNDLGMEFINQLPNLYNLGLGASGFAPLMQYGQLLGAPTVLGGASRGSRSGINIGTGE